MYKNYERTRFILRLAVLIALNVLIVAFAGYALSRYMARPRATAASVVNARLFPTSYTLTPASCALLPDCSHYQHFPVHLLRHGEV